MRSASFVFKDKVEVEQLEPGISRQIMGYNDELMLVKVMFETGAVGYQHNHPHSQVAYVESGVFDVTIEGETKRLSAGDSYYAQPNGMHGAVCIEGGVLLDMFSPIREDFFENYKKGDVT